MQTILAENTLNAKFSAQAQTFRILIQKTSFGVRSPCDILFVCKSFDAICDRNFYIPVLSVSLDKAYKDINTYFLEN